MVTTYTLVVIPTVHSYLASTQLINSNGFIQLYMAIQLRSVTSLYLVCTYIRSQPRYTANLNGYSQLHIYIATYIATYLKIAMYNQVARAIIRHSSQPQILQTINTAFRQLCFLYIRRPLSQLAIANHQQNKWLNNGMQSIWQSLRDSPKPPN